MLGHAKDTLRTCYDTLRALRGLEGLEGVLCGAEMALWGLFRVICCKILVIRDAKGVLGHVKDTLRHAKGALRGLEGRGGVYWGAEMALWGLFG